jgi:HEAT repeat protein
MKTIRWISAVAVLAGLTATLVYTLSTRDPSPGPSLAGSPAVPPAPAAEPEAPPATQPTTAVETTRPSLGPPAIHGRYRVSYAMTLESAGATGQKTGGGGLEAELSVMPVRRGGEDWLVGRITSGRLDVTPGQAGLPGGSAGLPQVVGEVAARRAANGTLSDVRFSATLPTPARGTLEALLYAAQLVPAANPSDAAWDGVENGANAAYQARYHQTPSGIEKTWSTPPASGSESAAAPYSESGRATFSLAGSVITSVAATQSASVDLRDGAGGAVRFEATLTWRRLGDADEPTLAAIAPDRLESLDRERLVETAGVADTPRSASDVATLVAQAASEAKAGDWQERHRIGQQLAGAIRADDATAAQVAAHARTAEDEPARRTALEALAAAGTPAAQSELVALSADRGLDAALRTQAFGAATFVRTPTAAFIEGLEAAAYSQDTVAMPSAAAVALAAAVRWDLDSRGVASSPAAARFAAEARRRLAPAVTPGEEPREQETPTTGDGSVAGGGQEPSEPVAGNPAESVPTSRLARREWTRAAGNAALPELAPALHVLLTDPDEYVRAAAAFSARFYEPGPLVSALADIAQNDDSILVREAVAGACQYLGPGPCETLVRKAIVFDKSEHVRQSFAYTVGTWLHDAPAMASILEEALKVEKSPKVSETLLNYLYPGRVAHPFREIGGTPGGGQAP